MAEPTFLGLLASYLEVRTRLELAQLEYYKAMTDQALENAKQAVAYRTRYEGETARAADEVIDILRKCKKAQKKEP